ncbi:MAG: inositol monophosphatase [Candidatus Latescibacteria bacterium]|nr:inositol monophosphatase [Candidatus Latescibacterota bacterium]
MIELTHEEKKQLFEIACDAARQSGKILKDNFGKKKEISFKGRINPVTNVDLLSEKTIIDVINTHYPDHDIITEESNLKQSGSVYRWIIDPLDGTVNYSHNYPFFAVSVALEVNGIVEIGIVYNPVMNEFFRACRGEGAFCNDTPIFISDIDNLERSLLVTGFPYDINEKTYNNLAHFNHMMKYTQGVRRDGSAALNLCYCAMGRFDGYWEISISPWDIAAGILITTEAGGTVSKLDGNPLSVFDGELVASNGKIHEKLVEHLQIVNREQY